MRVAIETYWNISVKWIFATLTLTLSLSSTARDESAPILVAIDEWRPFIAQDFREYGVVSHIVKEAFASQGRQVRFIWAPWKRAYANVRGKHWDASPGWTRSPEREKEVYFSDPLFAMYQVFFHLKKYPFAWESYDDLRTLRLGGTLGYYYGEEFSLREQTKELTIERVDTDALNFKKLVKGRIDAFPVNILTGMHIARNTLTKDEANSITFSPRPLYEGSHSHMVFPRTVRGRKLRDTFNSGLTYLKESGRFDALMKASQLGEYEIPAAHIPLHKDNAINP